MAGTLTIDTLQDGSSNSSSVTDVVKGSARAWVNFNGTGTVAIRSAYNVSSITDTATGLYRVNFTNALSDADYSVPISVDSATSTASTIRVNSLTTTTVDIDNWVSGIQTDCSVVCAAVFGN